MKQSTRFVQKILTNPFWSRLRIYAFIVTDWKLNRRLLLPVDYRNRESCGNNPRSDKSPPFMDRDTPACTDTYARVCNPFNSPSCCCFDRRYILSSNRLDVARSFNVSAFLQFIPSFFLSSLSSTPISDFYNGSGESAIAGNESMYTTLLKANSECLSGAISELWIFKHGRLQTI